jgi:hypothetical protein
MKFNFKINAIRLSAPVPQNQEISAPPVSGGPLHRGC